MIKNSNTIYAISDNYIYDQIYKKQKIFRNNIREILNPRYTNGDVIIIPERDSASYIFTDNPESIHKINFLLEYGLIKEIQNKFELYNFDKKYLFIKLIYLYKLTLR